MWKFDRKKIYTFFQFLDNLILPKKLFAVSCLLLAILYPGHNYLQRIIINDGSKISIPVKNSFAPYPVSDAPRPNTSAYSVFVADGENKSLLYAKNPDAELLPASTTKLMTALVTRDLYPDIEKILTVTVEDHSIGASMKLYKGEKISVANLLAGLLIPSGNDAALTLANNAPGGYAGFVEAMNHKAQELHLDHTTYRNPSGVEQYGHVTSARDLAILISAVVDDEVLVDLMTTPSLTVTNSSATIKHYLKSTDDLLTLIPGIKGAKTGWTDNAGECLVTYVSQEGNSIITVVLKSQDRFGDTRALLHWAFAHHTWML